MQLALKNLVKKYQQGKDIQPIVYEEDWSDKLEPYAAGLGLAGDAVGLGAAATGVGIPVGTVVAAVTNVPNLVIDGYQTVRDGYRAYKDNGASLGSAAWNAGEFVLDAAGLKFLSYINKSRKAGIAAAKTFSGLEKAATSPYRRVGTGAGRVMARKSAERKAAYNAARNKALKESNEELVKKGVRASQGAYYEQKLADAMAKRGYGVAVNDAIKSVNRTARQNLGLISGVSAGTNVYHLQKKQGGKMQLLKNGSGIHIKKKNRGKFTSYCGGKVTDSCIRRAKASGNPTLVKRATFAANARKWKHQNGGILQLIMNRYE